VAVERVEGLEGEGIVVVVTKPRMLCFSSDRHGVNLKQHSLSA
jgi:hypothetical protein